MGLNPPVSDRFEPTKLFLFAKWQNEKEWKRFENFYCFLQIQFTKLLFQKPAGATLLFCFF